MQRHDRSRQLHAEALVRAFSRSFNLKDTEQETRAYLTTEQNSEANRVISRALGLSSVGWTSQLAVSRVAKSANELTFKLFDEYNTRTYTFRATD